METDRSALKEIIHTRGSAEALTATSQGGHWEASADPRAWIISFNADRSVSICVQDTHILTWILPPAYRRFPFAPVQNKSGPPHSGVESGGNDASHRARWT